MEETAALLGSTATKQRLAGVTGLLEQLRRQDAVPESSATLIPHVLPCLRDHNSKIALGALEILELLVARVTESTLRSYLKLLWISLVERLGDNKLPIRQKAVDVVVEISVVLDAITVLDKLKGCMSHKNWRTREQSDLEYKNIRAAHMKTLTERFKGLPIRSKSVADDVCAARSRDGGSSLVNSEVPASNNVLPDELSSILSSYDLHVSSSSSSMARYLASVHSRTLNEAKAVAASTGGERSPSQASSTDSQTVQEISAESSFGAGSNDISEKELQKQLGGIFDKLELDNNWDKRVDGLKMLQKLANRCSKASNSGTALSLLSQGLRSVRERLCLQVSDLRSSVSREACQTIRTLANTLRDEFNAHAEICLGNLLKATYVTIQVISTSADTTIKSMIESTSNGYGRKWSVSFLSKHSDLFVPIMPALLQDALGDVRAQSRKCYWSYHHLFPDEAKSIFSRLDGSTQKNLNDDPSKFTAKAARHGDYSLMDAAAPQSSGVVRSALRTTNAAQPLVLNSVRVSDEQPRFDGEELSAGKLPMRVPGGGLTSVGIDSGEKNVQSSRLLSHGPMRVGLAARAKSSVLKDSSASANKKKKSTAAGPLRVLNPSKPSQSTNESHTSRQEPSTAGFHTSSQQQAFKAQRIQLAGETQSPVPMDIDEGETRGPKRLPLVSIPSPTASNASSSRTNNSKSDSGDIKPKRIAPTKSSERPKVTQLPVADQLEEAIRNIERSSWSTRLEAAEYIGKYLRRRVDQIESGASGDHKVDGRILTAFIKHLSDSHYRVSQSVLKNLLPLLKLSNDSQRLLPHLKTVLPKLFQKFIDTKESIRAGAKENLEYIASTVDSSTLAAIVISMLGDGSNMKVKAAMCHFLRELLPGAEEYMKHGANNSHMRSLLLKIALLMDTDVPVSVSSACGELVSVAAQLYGSEMEVALGLLPPSKRLVVSKILKSKKIVLNFSNPPRPPFSTSSTAPLSTRTRDDDNDNQEIPPAPKPERSRKRVESPSVSSSSPPRQNSQKRINTTSQKTSPLPAEGQSINVRQRSSAAVERANEMVAKTTPAENVSFSSALFSSVGDRVDKHDDQLEDILHILEQNNLSEAELKHALHKTLHFIEIKSSETWDRCFGRLLLLLLDAATEGNVYALKVLQRLVEAQPSRAQMFFELLLQRLIDAMVDQVDVARHLMERILHDLVSSAGDHQQTLSVLIPLDSNREPPTLQVVLRLIKVCFQICERSSAQNSAFLRKHDVAQRIMSVLSRRLDHASSNVRKTAVDCLVAFHFATKEDSSIVPKYLASKLDDTRRRLVEIFIDRAKMERHHIGLLST
ncbi:CLIP-associating protein 1 [Phytophthora nicotianae]|uniref:CLIP-associating protein 1 n=1 Tax=Phytophthora nicotianae TaxID=4792 RepID=A0A0W8DZG0_PHYNI|nr:CLIP-associating protein 1 [Phytophthora nicotianae]